MCRAIQPYLISLTLACIISRQWRRHRRGWWLCRCRYHVLCADGICISPQIYHIHTHTQTIVYRSHHTYTIRNIGGRAQIIAGLMLKRRRGRQRQWWRVVTLLCNTYKYILSPDANTMYMMAKLEFMYIEPLVLADTIVPHGKCVLCM